MLLVLSSQLGALRTITLLGKDILIFRLRFYFFVLSQYSISVKF